jgi:transposase
MVKHLRPVPHTLTPIQKTEHTTFSIKHLDQLRSIEHHGWQFIITLDESWFYLSTDHEQIWLRVEEQGRERPRHTIQGRKLMVTIVWNPLEFHLLDASPKGNTFNTEYYRVNILTELLPLRPKVHERRVVIHADNARPHTARKCRAFCEENRLRLAIHTPYSPDLVPSDFFLFGHIKRCLQGIPFPSPKELLATIHEIVGPSRGQLWRMCLDTRWGGPNGLRVTMVTTIHKLNNS